MWSAGLAGGRGKGLGGVGQIQALVGPVSLVLSSA